MTAPSLEWLGQEHRRFCVTRKSQHRENPKALQHQIDPHQLQGWGGMGRVGVQTIHGKSFPQVAIKAASEICLQVAGSQVQLKGRRLLALAWSLGPSTALGGSGLRFDLGTLQECGEGACHICCSPPLSTFNYSQMISCSNVTHSLVFFESPPFSKL